MSSNLNNLIEEKIKEFDEKFGCTRNCQSYIKDVMFQFWRDSITEAVEKTLEEVALKEEILEPPYEYVENQFVCGWNDAVEKQNKLKSNWLK